MKKRIQIEKKWYLFFLLSLLNCNLLGQGFVTTGGVANTPTAIFVNGTSIVNNSTNINSIYVGKGLNQGNNANIGIGYSGVLSSTSSALYNVAIGTAVLQNATSGQSNVGIGEGALRGLSTIGPSYPCNCGQFNIALGKDAMANSYALTSNSPSHNSDNIALGRNSLLSNYGVENIAIGLNALKDNVSGAANIAIGKLALQSSTTGSHNIAIGSAALSSTTGTNNIAIGPNALGSITGNNNVGIGAGALVPNSTNNDQLSIQNVIYGTTMLSAASGKIGIGIAPIGTASMPAGVYAANTIAKLHVNGTLRIDKASLFSSTSIQPKYLFIDAQGMVAEAPAPTAGGGVTGIANTYTPSTGVLVTTINATVSSAPVTISNLYNSDGTLLANRTVNMDGKFMIFNTGGNTTTTGGRVYIGNTTAFTSGPAGTNFPVFFDATPANTRDYRLYVEGGILTERIKVALRSTANWADYVFADDYKLRPLKEVESFIKINKHLPEICNAEDLVKNGLDLGEMQAKQMGKIEELTLYIIEQNNKLEKQQAELEALKAEVKILSEKSK